MAGFRLGDAERERFEREGWLGPYPLLPRREARSLADELRACHARTRGYFYPGEVRDGESHYGEVPWYQSLHTLSPRVVEIARRPEIVERVAELLGEDLMLWGSICFRQRSGESIHWHTDTEFDYLRGVSVWLAVRNVKRRNVLKLLPGSHRCAETPEDHISKGGLDIRDLTRDEKALSLVRASQPHAEVVRPAVRDGDFFLFNGKLWHSSRNPTRRSRVALGLRYSPPDQQVRIPLSYLHPVRWDPKPAPCLLVRGRDRHGLNDLVEPPRATDGLRAPRSLPA